MEERTPGIRPRPSLGRRLDIAARYAFPGATTALMLLVAAGPLGLPAQAQLQGALVLGCVFFWSLYRPASLPPLLVFALGALADLLGYGPIGVGVLVLLVAHGLAMMWRRALARHGFLVVWLAFMAVAAGAAALQWVLTSLLTLRPLPFGPMAFQAVVAAGFYPLLSVVLNRAHATVAEPARA
jgi:rod shape-determining protein MreD